MLRKPAVVVARGVLCAALLFTEARWAPAAELEPRAYVNTPVGLNFMIAGYAYSVGGWDSEEDPPLQEAHLQIHTTFLSYLRTLDVWGNSGKLAVVLPYSWLSGSAQVNGRTQTREISGFNDPSFRFSVNFYGSPALTAKAFTKYQQDLILGASVQVSPPLGQYDANRLVNLGTNRWFFKPDIGISQAWGQFTLELSTGVFLYTQNNDYLGGNTLAQDPVWTTQGHFSYSFGYGIWVALDGIDDYGGSTRLNGAPADDLQGNWRAGATLAFPVDRFNSVKLHYSTGVYTRFGTNYDLAGIAWQYHW